MRALWYDVFKNGQTIADADPKVIAKETDTAWKSTIDTTHTRFFNIIKDDSEHKIIGAVVHLTGFKDYTALVEYTKTIPWMVYNFADGDVFPFTNYVSVLKLFHQNGRYLGIDPVKRLETFNTNPIVSWYVVIKAKKSEGYEAKYGLDDALQKFRLLKGGIAEEVFDLESPEQGSFLRLKANNRPEVEHYTQEFSSVREMAADVLLLRVISTCVWDFAFF